MVKGHLPWFPIAAAESLVPYSLESSCDRTTSEMRGLSPKIILRDSRRSENVQTHT
jgi:hypothetical protein